MTSFFKRALDAYRILTGKDDAVQKGIMQLQKEIAQREARRAAQQAELEKQILDELRQSSEALKTIKDGYIAREQEIVKFAAELGQSVQTQLAAQAEAEAQIFLESARRSGIQLKAPPPFSEFVKRANLGLVSGEAATAMLGEMRRGSGLEGTYAEAGRAGVERAEFADAVREAENGKADQGADQSVGDNVGQSSLQEWPDGEVQKSFSDAGPNMILGRNEGVGQTEPAAKAEAGHEQEAVQEEGILATAGDRKAVPLSAVKVDSESSSGSESDSDEELRMKPRLVSADPEKEVNELGGVDFGGQEGEHTATVEVEVSELPLESVHRNGTISTGAERQAGSNRSTPWGEAVESGAAEIGQEKRRKVIARCIETVEALKRFADGDEQPLPPLESDVIRSAGEVEEESGSGKPESGESTRRRNRKKIEEVGPKIEKGPQAPKARKKRAPGRKKAEL